jgi:hypothetical protein
MLDREPYPVPPGDIGSLDRGEPYELPIMQAFLFLLLTLARNAVL